MENNKLRSFEKKKNNFRKIYIKITFPFESLHLTKYSMSSGGNIPIVASGSKEGRTAKPGSSIKVCTHNSWLQDPTKGKAQVEKGVGVRRDQRLLGEGGNTAAGQVLVGVLVGKRGGQEEAGASGGFADRRNDRLSWGRCSCICRGHKWVC